MSLLSQNNGSVWMFGKRQGKEINSAWIWDEICLIADWRAQGCDVWLVQEVQRKASWRLQTVGWVSLIFNNGSNPGFVRPLSRAEIVTNFSFIFVRNSCTYCGAAIEAWVYILIIYLMMVYSHYHFPSDMSQFYQGSLVCKNLNFLHPPLKKKPQ